MDWALYLTFVLFVVSMSVTPGPNNLMMMSSSIVFGVKRTLPHWIGVNIGFNLMLVAAVFGLGELVQRFPWMLTVIKVAGSLWLAWMAWQFLRAALFPVPSGTSENRSEGSRPLHWYEAALFQWVNPKAILMTVSAAGVYYGLADAIWSRAAIMAGTFAVLGPPCGMAWILAGGVLRRFMSDPRWARPMNAVIAGILLLTIGLILAG